MFPFMAQGHIIPFIALANRIQQISDSYTITFVPTPLNINKIKSCLPPNSSNIRVAEIPFSGTDYGLPPLIENTDVLPYHLFPNFLDAILSLKPSRKFISFSSGCVLLKFAFTLSLKLCLLNINFCCIFLLCEKNSSTPVVQSSWVLLPLY